MSFIPTGNYSFLPKLTPRSKFVIRHSGLVRTMVEEINEAGGNFTVNDFINYSIKVFPFALPDVF